MTGRKVPVAASAAAVVVASALLIAGPLDPPSGPVSSTYKTLFEVEPRTAVTLDNTPGDPGAVFVIREPGSYYLTGNVVGEAGKSGVAIEASNVTLDLNGFTLQGVEGSLHGVESRGGNRFVHVRNGMVRDWDGSGIMLADGGLNSSVVGVETAYNGADGMSLASNAFVRECVSMGNGSRGIYCQSNSVVEHCEVRSNGFRGIQVADGCAVRNCVSRADRHTGIVTSDAATVTDCFVISTLDEGTGIFTNSYCTIERCTVTATEGDGISTRSDSVVINNSVHRAGFGDFQGAAILVGQDDCRVENNNVTESDFGVRVLSEGNVIIRNSASGNSSDYSIVFGNFVGTIVTSEAQMNAANNANINMSY